MITTGLAVLLRAHQHPVHNQRVGLVSHAAAVTTDLHAAQDSLLAAGYRLAALFGPEHGMNGAALDGASISHQIDSRTGLPVYSLYGETREPTWEMLSNLDRLIFDMQDAGVRFYTYLSTLYYVLRAAGKTSLPVMILDRPNPLGGEIVEGPAIEPGFESFVGIAAGLPIRHGMTLGEMAGFLNKEHNLNAEIQVVRMRGWKRSKWFDQTGLPWSPTSPAMPHLSTVILYPGMCLLEGTNISEGRGTALPFEICGAPWIDAASLTRELTGLELPGVRFRPHCFIPSSSKYDGLVCQGVQVYITDRKIFAPVALGAALVSTIKRLYPHDFAWNDSFDRLAGSQQLREEINSQVSLVKICAGWRAAEQTFSTRRASYLLYS